MRARTRNLGIAGAVAAAATLTGALFLSSGGLQETLDAAQCGAVIEIEANVAHVGNLTLKKPCPITNPITVQSSRVNELPDGVRVTPADSPKLAKLQSAVNGEPVIKTVAGASGYRFIGVDISTTSESVVVYDLVRFGEGRETQKTLGSVASGITVDRSYIHGWPTQDVQRGVTVNSADTTVSNSYISEIHGVGYDTQGIAGWNGTRNFKAINNYVEAAGENIMFGGADSATAELMPIGIELRHNYLFKPLSWKVGHPSFVPIIRDGIVTHWTVKNLLELKSAKNVVIDGNVLENNWTDGQAGVAVLFTVRNQECTNPWATVQNVTWSNNTVRNSDGGALNFLGKDNEAEPTHEDRPGHPKCSDPGESFGSIRGSGFTGTNNLFYDIQGSFLTLNGFDDVSINRTTHVQRGNLTTIYGQPSQRWKYTNNLTVDHQYGIYTEAGPGIQGMNTLTPGWTMEANVVIAPYDRSSWPPNNQFADLLSLPPDFRSPFPSAGADIDAMLAAQAGAGTSQPSPQPSATATATPTSTATPSLPVSPDGTRIPSAAQIIDNERAVWTLNGQTMLRNGSDTGGRGPLLLWFGGRIYAIGVDSNWWGYLGGTAWERVTDPTGAPTPAPTATATQQSSPPPSPSPTATVAPPPSPSPSASVLRQCRRDEVIGSPARCLCTGRRIGNPPRCRP
jgi:hypothetical protein